MSSKEAQTLEELSKKFNLFFDEYQKYKAEDQEWKNKVTVQLTPLVEERTERMIIQNAGKYVWKGLVAIVGFAATIGVLVHYFPEILKTLRIH